MEFIRKNPKFLSQMTVIKADLAVVRIRRENEPTAAVAAAARGSNSNNKRSALLRGAAATPNKLQKTRQPV